MTKYIQLVEKKKGKIVKNQQIDLYTFFDFNEKPIWTLCINKPFFVTKKSWNKAIEHAYQKGWKDSIINQKARADILIIKDNIHTTKKRRLIVPKR